MIKQQTDTNADMTKNKKNVVWNMQECCSIQKALNDLLLSMTMRSRGGFLISL
jgi:hypothetical protein